MQYESLLSQLLLQVGAAVWRDHQGGGRRGGGEAKRGHDHKEEKQDKDVLFSPWRDTGGAVLSVVVTEREGMGGGGGRAARIASHAASHHVSSGDSAGVCELFAMASALASSSSDGAARDGAVADAARAAAAQYDCRALRIACAELGSRLAVSGAAAGAGEGRQVYTRERRRWLHLSHQLLSWSPTGVAATEINVVQCAHLDIGAVLEGVDINAGAAACQYEEGKLSWRILPPFWSFLEGKRLRVLQFVTPSQSLIRLMYKAYQNGLQYDYGRGIENGEVEGFMYRSHAMKFEELQKNKFNAIKSFKMERAKRERNK